MLNRNELDHVLDILTIEFIDDQLQSTHLRRGLDDEHCVLLFERRHRSVGRDEILELLCDGLRLRIEQRQDHGDDLVVGDLRGQRSHKRRNILLLHLIELLQKQPSAFHAQHAILSLQQHVERLQRFAKRVILGIDVVDSALRDFDFAHDGIASDATEVVENLIVRLPLEIESQSRRGRGL